jgi:hypothetical protein
VVIAVQGTAAASIPISTIPEKYLNQYTSNDHLTSRRFEVSESLVERYLGKAEVGGPNPPRLLFSLFSISYLCNPLPGRATKAFDVLRKSAILRNSAMSER